MRDAACPGNVFSAPNTNRCWRGETVDRGGGVIFIVKTNAGDIISSLAWTEGVHEGVSGTLSRDDVAIERF